MNMFSPLFQTISQKASELFQGGEELLRFAPSLTITLLNVILPQIFNILSKFEDWSPAFEVNVTLFRYVSHYTLTLVY